MQSTMTLVWALNMRTTKAGLWDDDPAGPLEVKQRLVDGIEYFGVKALGNQ